MSKSLAFNYDGVTFDFDIGDQERIISETVEQSGVWEENQLSLYRGLIPQGGVFLDIGANVGVNSLFAKLAIPDATVIAVEPEPGNYALLQENISRSGCVIRMMNVAIADKPGSMGFEGTGTNAHLSNDPEATQVKCVTLDSFTEDLRAIDLLKIDVEGFTDLVLSRSAETLGRTSATIIEFSYGDIERRLEMTGGGTSYDDVLRHCEELFDTLRPHFSNYYYISRKDGLVELRETKDLLPIMLSEAAVGDILATKAPVKESIADISFAMRTVLELKQQNYQRILDIAALNERLNGLIDSMKGWIASVDR